MLDHVLTPQVIPNRERTIWHCILMTE